MPAFWIGIAMVSYDMLGHAVAAICGALGRGDLWNKYSPLIWPVLIDDKIKDLYWALWFLTAFTLIVAGHFIVGDTSPRIPRSVISFTDCTNK